MKASDLQGTLVRTESGQRLGRVTELRVESGEVTTLVCGKSGLLQRFTSSARGHRVKWSDVRRVTAQEIVVADRP
jgi:sporulation protein YlmC with PRC-barrel domain